MGTAVIDLNDQGLGAWDRDGQLLLQSPAFALEQSDGSILVGDAAWKRWRMQPTLVNNRFWDELSLEPLPRHAGGAIRSNADYACDHMTSVWETLQQADIDDVILAVPGNLSRHQLSLLLGIARECAMPVLGMIDKGVASAARPYPGRSLMHLDIQLHRLVLTRLSQGARLSRSGVESSTRVGLASLYELWIRAIAKKFISHTRLDPLHDAANEQLLFERLPQWLETAEAEGSVKIEVEVGGKTHAVTMSAQELIDETTEPYTQALRLISDIAHAGDSLTLLLSHRIRALPGLQSLLGSLPDCELIGLDANAAALGALAHEQMLRGAGGQVSFVTHVPWREDDAQANAPSEAAGAAETPSHVLYRGRAWPIGEQLLTVGSDVAELPYGLVLNDRLGGVSRKHCQFYRNGSGVVLEDRSTYGTYLNGVRVSGKTRVAIGDRVRIGTPGHELQMIGVVRRDGT